MDAEWRELSEGFRKPRIKRFGAFFCSSFHLSTAGYQLARFSLTQRYLA